MSEALFEATPLAEYLDEAGLQDWGIDDSFSSDLHLSSESDIDRDEDHIQTHSRERSRLQTPQILDKRLDRGPRDGQGLYPLVLDGNGQSIAMRQSRFRSLIHVALLSNVSAKETQQFLEQFRYIVVSSQLLEPKPIYTTWSMSADDRRCQLLFSNSGPWDILKLERKHWVGGGGCVLVVAVLLHWRSKQPNSLHRKQADLAFIVALLVILYLFSHSRRRLLRRLRANSLAYMDRFVLAAKCFDGDVVRALKTVQELELVDNGFSVHAKPRDQNTIRTAKKLRAVLSAALQLATEAHLDAIKDCLCMCSELDLGQYFEIYNVNPSEFGFVMNDTFVGFQEPDFTSSSDWFGPNACYTPLKTLKLQFRKVHFLRRAFLCCMLSVSSIGNCNTAELESWTVVTDQLKSSQNLLEQLSSMVSKERLHQPQDSLTDSVGDISGHTTASDRSRNLRLSELGATAHHFAARLEILQSGELALDEYNTHAEQLEMELKELNRLWKDSVSANKPSAESSIVRNDLGEISSPSTTAVESPDMGSMLSTMSETSFESTLHEYDVSGSKSKAPQLFESIAPLHTRPRSTLSREERIRVNQEQRSAAASHQTSQRTNDLFMKELENVLKHRSSTNA